MLNRIECCGIGQLLKGKRIVIVIDDDIPKSVFSQSDAICIIEYFIFDIDLTIQLDGLRSFRYIERRKIRITIILHDASNPVFLTIIALQSYYALGPEDRKSVV